MIKINELKVAELIDSLFNIREYNSNIEISLCNYLISDVIADELISMSTNLEDS